MKFASYQAIKTFNNFLRGAGNSRHLMCRIITQKYLSSYYIYLPQINPQTILPLKINPKPKAYDKILILNN